MEVEWKDIPGYEGMYQASNYGDIKSVDRYISVIQNGKTCIQKHKGHLLKSTFSKTTKYNVVHLSNKNGKRKTELVHRLIAIAHVENVHGFDIVNHKDENKLNNRSDNLEWCTIKYNSNYGNSKSKIRRAKSIPALQFDKDGNFIKRWESATLAAKTLGYEQAAIQRACVGTSRTSYDSAQGNPEVFSFWEELSHYSIF